ncbi:MAG: hypothetical protein K9L75_06620 [Spirochaetia bacterium]|nr:hypothetical protein [Spirochaetia bacterium]
MAQVFVKQTNPGTSLLFDENAEQIENVRHVKTSCTGGKLFAEFIIVQDQGAKLPRKKRSTKKKESEEARDGGSESESA